MHLPDGEPEFGPWRVSSVHDFFDWADLMADGVLRPLPVPGR